MNRKFYTSTRKHRKHPQNDLLPRCNAGGHYKKYPTTCAKCIWNGYHEVEKQLKKPFNTPTLLQATLLYIAIEVRQRYGYKCYYNGMDKSHQAWVNMLKRNLDSIMTVINLTYYNIQENIKPVFDTTLKNSEYITLDGNEYICKKINNNKCEEIKIPSSKLPRTIRSLRSNNRRRSPTRRSRLRSTIRSQSRSTIRSRSRPTKRRRSSSNSYSNKSRSHSNKRRRTHSNKRRRSSNPTNMNKDVRPNKRSRSRPTVTASEKRHSLPLVSLHANDTYLSETVSASGTRPSSHLVSLDANEYGIPQIDNNA